MNSKVLDGFKYIAYSWQIILGTILFFPCTVNPWLCEPILYDKIRDIIPDFPDPILSFRVMGSITLFAGVLAIGGEIGRNWSSNKL
jgi:hypothetical protein